MKRSAGLLLYRFSDRGLEVLLVHPGGPYWARRDDGAWSIPKGEIQGDEAPLAAARREFREETGVDVDGEFIALDAVRLASGKVVYAWAVAGDFDPAHLRSNEFELPWPPKSGERRRFPEVDRAAWFTLTDAERKIHPGQAPLLPRLRQALAARANVKP
ncbi:MAG: NUDIX domain-containing protein [Sutterellaceae bacterium]|nr:NUDIX domain-containing protein [Burkholderiaceae bacterium]MCX7900973.1 NUDIX domain-containing protein [Burkholderiaceae bacterium]MDW8430614.1 NUDIX domain-containing protein [Sutterellaceae bacterium]